MAENDEASSEPSSSDANSSTDEAETARPGEVAPTTTSSRPEGGAEKEASAAPSRYRRLHTLSGAVVLGAFLLEHLLTNASALGGGASYDAVVGAIERWSLLPVFEVVFIVIPLGFHAGYGIHLLRQGRTGDADAAIARFGDRRLWVLQRISAVVLLVFVLVHLWELRLQRLFFGLSADALHTTLTGRLSWTWGGVPWIALFYLLGLLAAATHLSNGLFAATDALNIARGEPRRRRMRLVTTGLGLVLFLVGASTVIGLATGTRLLPGADDDSAAPSAPCGSAVPEPSAPFKLPTPSR